MQTRTRPPVNAYPGGDQPPLSGKASSTRHILVAALIVVMLASIAGGTYFTTHASRQALVNADTAVLTYKGDTSRTGQYSNETILNTSNVTVSQFGKRVAYPVDGYVYAQPLYMPNVLVNVNGNPASHNVVFVATANDSIYAFDADQTSATAPLWHISFINPPSVTPINGTEVSCSDANPKMGILGTPVIDPSTGTLYAVAATWESSHVVYRIHALDITTGQEKHAPTVIQASVPGTGPGSSNGVLKFDPLHTNQRPGLLLLNGVVYTAWSSYCDKGPYHGWLMGYEASTLQQVSVYNASPNSSDSGIWESGEGLGADDSGNIYVMTGNGTFDLNSGGKDAGDTFLKLSTQNGISRADYFTPFNQSCLVGGADLDLGSSGPLLLPSTSTPSPELVGVGKQGRIYVVNRSNMGGYTVVSNPCSKQNSNLDHIVQELPLNTVGGGAWSTMAYYHGSNGDYIYAVGQTDHMKAFKLDNATGMLSTSPTSQTSESFTFPGGSPAVSSNGTAAGTGVLWTIDPKAVLRAYDATNLGTELYNSQQNANRDGLGSGNYVKFTVPTVANGEVFVGTRTSLVIYGLLGQTPPPSPVPSPSPSPSPSPTGGSGTLTGSKASVSGQIYLNATGPTDWAHWGTNTAASFDHKANVTSQISNYTEVGSATVVRLTNNGVGYTWMSGSGTPTSGASDTKTGIYVTGTGNGFTITVPASTTKHTLKVYVGVSKAQGSFSASLSDNSAAPYSDTSLQNSSGTTNEVYTLTYQAGSNGQTLTISFTMQSSLGSGGYVSLQSATLQ
jgi:hypothetical protein